MTIARIPTLKTSFYLQLSLVTLSAPSASSTFSSTHSINAIAVLLYRGDLELPVSKLIERSEPSTHAHAKFAVKEGDFVHVRP